MELPLFYAGLALDRMTERRGDAAWLAALIQDPRSRLAPVWRAQNLVTEGDAPEPIFLPPSQAPVRDGSAVLLGIADEIAYFTADVSHIDEPDLPQVMGSGGRFVDLRSVGGELDRRHGALLAYARGLAYWHSRHLFCGACGAPNASVEAGHVRRCTNPGCKTDHFPRTDPAVIMLVTRGDKCLLARNARNALPMYSTLAGYVEPGESLEEAVAREVYEESAIRVIDVRYQSSQPWPFPSSLMLGFRARALNDEIKVDDAELTDAGWFDRDYLRGTLDPDKFRLPRSVSIARGLIQDWLDEG